MQYVKYKLKGCCATFGDICSAAFRASPGLACFNRHCSNVLHLVSISTAPEFSRVSIDKPLYFAGVEIIHAFREELMNDEFAP
jgi:hypothetical protein